MDKADSNTTTINHNRENLAFRIHFCKPDNSIIRISKTTRTWTYSGRSREVAGDSASIKPKVLVWMEWPAHRLDNYLLRCTNHSVIEK